MKRIIAVALLIVVFAFSTANALVPYKTFVNHAEYGLTHVQSAYLPDWCVYTFGGEELANPSDIKLGPDGYLYLCDHGHQRIVVVTTEGDLVRTIGDRSVLKGPKGVFVTRDGRVWVADETGRAIVVFSPAGEVLARYEKPDSPLLSGASSFRPNKIVVSPVGVMYINVTGGTNGLLQMTVTENGAVFMGFYGANRTVTNALTRIRKTLFGRSDYFRNAGIIPTSISNIALDGKGFVYTVSGARDSLVKRLNAGGNNTVAIDYQISGASAITVDDHGMIYAADRSGGIYQYSSEGELLFTFGAMEEGDMRLGCFQTVSGLEVDSDGSLYVLDESAGSLQKLTPTSLTQQVRHAMEYFRNGRYKESEAPWREVLRQCSLFTYAYNGLGEAMYRRGDYEGAMNAFALGGDKEGYSDAFWQVRNDSIRRFLPVLIIAAACLAITGRICKSVRKKHGNTRQYADARSPRMRRLRKGIRAMALVIVKPEDGCYAIQREGACSLSLASVMLALYLASVVLSKYGAGYLFRTYQAGRYTILEDVCKALYIILMSILCCYLVCTIRDGEAKWKHLACGLSFAMLPVTVSNLIAAILTNVLTYHEGIFIALVYVIGWIWTGVAALLVILNMNAYSLRKTIQTVLLTLFTMLILTGMAWALIQLSRNLYGFVNELAAEGAYRFGGS